MVKKVYDCKSYHNASYEYSKQNLFLPKYFFKFFNAYYFAFSAVCTDSEPVITNGIVVYRTYMPSSITYGCSPGFVGEGVKNVIHCFPDNKWETPVYSCYLGIKYFN